MRRPRLEGRCRAQHLGGRVAAEHLDLCHLGPAAGQGAGLVEHHVSAHGEILERAPIGHQHAMAGQCAAGRGQRSRRGQRKRTRAGHDQHRNRDRQRTARIDPPPGRQNHCREQQQAQHEPAGDPVGQLRHGGLVLCGTFDQPLQRRDRAVGAAAQDAGQHGIAGIDGAAGHFVARPARHRRRFAGQQRLVDRRVAGEQADVDRKAQPVADPDQVPRDQARRGNRLGARLQERLRSRLTGVGQTLDPLGQGRCQAVDRAAGAPARHPFEVARRQQQENEHRHRVEIHIAALNQRGPQAGCERGADAQRHRHVHAQRPGLQVAPGARKERLSGIEHHRRGEQQAGPAHQVFVLPFDVAGLRGVDRERIHHHLHHAQAGNEEPTEQRPAGAGELGFAPPGVVGQCAIADRRDVCQQRRQAGGGGIPPQHGALGGEIDRCRQHARLGRERALDQPHAGAAAHALQQQGHFGAGGPLGWLAHDARLNIGLVIEGQLLGQFAWNRVGAGGRRAAVPIVVGQAGRFDRLCDSLAARAAHLARLAIDPGEPAARLQHRQAAVKTREGLQRKAQNRVRQASTT